jgi:hypothetical protein
MKQRDASYGQRTKSSRGGDTRHEDRNTMRTFFKTSHECLFSSGTEQIAACREGIDNGL